VSGTGSKCPEMIGYIGDVRNLEAHRAEATSNKKIEAWVKRSNSVIFATLFYSSDDVYHISSQQTKLLKINPDLKFKQISSIKEFIDYVDTGMDRNEHPVKDIEMINVYSTWEIDVDYVEEARKRHEPEVRQISKKDLKKIGDAFVKKTIINIFLGNKEQNQTKPITDAEVYQQVKDSYGWDQASAIKDQILATSDVAKNGVDELKEKRELLMKGIKSLPEVKPQTVLIKVGASVATHAGTIFEAYGAYETTKKVQKLDTELSTLNDKKKMLDCKHPSDENFKKCINISEEQLHKMKVFIKDVRGF